MKQFAALWTLLTCLIGAGSLPAWSAQQEPVNPRPTPAASSALVGSYYQLSRLPSELLDAPRAELDPVMNALDAELTRLTESSEMSSVPLLGVLSSLRMHIAIHRGDWLAAEQYLRQQRNLEPRLEDKLTRGVVLETCLEARLRGGSLAAQRDYVKAALRETLHEMRWAVVGQNLRQTQAQLENLSSTQLRAELRATLDPLATKLELRLPLLALATLLAARSDVEI